MGYLEEEEEQEEESSQSPIRLGQSPTPTPRTPDSDDFYKYRINSADIIDEIEHQLRGEILDEIKGQWTPSGGKWIDDEGIADILSILYGCGINRNTFLGNLTKDEINARCNHLWKELSLYLFHKYKKYNVDKAKRSLLVKKIVYIIHSALSRSEGGKEADQLSIATQRHEIYQQQLNPHNGANPIKRFIGRFGGGR